MQLVSKIAYLCDPDPPTSQTDRQTDRRTDNMRSQYRALHYSASRGKNDIELASIAGVIMSLQDRRLVLFVFPHASNTETDRQPMLPVPRQPTAVLFALWLAPYLYKLSPWRTDNTYA